MVSDIIVDMNTSRPWAFWRRVKYGTGFATFWSLIGTLVYFGFFYVPVNCFDNLQNGNEAGVDCDGSCVRICPFSVESPRVMWAESFKIIEGQYNAVAYIENKNSEAATPALAYTFRLLKNEEVIAEKSGITILPPNSVYPIFEGRILTTDGKEPTQTTIEIEPADMWLPASVGRDQFRTLDIELLSADARPKLKVKVENTELTDAHDVEVVATIFSQSGKPLTASQTSIDDFSARSTEEIVFTWPNSIAKTVRSCEVPSDIMLILDKSGSMAADGGDPPQPLENAKQAAKSFVGLVRDHDLLGYFSYATNPSSPIEQTLTSNHNFVSEAIQSTVMGEDGVQYTNMGAAFSTALEELIGSRHREDARKVIVFLTDGDVTRPVNPKTGKADREYAAQYALDMAKKAKEENITIYTIGFGDFFLDKDESIERDIELISNLSSGEGFYFEAPTVNELESVYKEIAAGLCEDGVSRIDVITKTKTNFAPLR